jgi:transposase
LWGRIEPLLPKVERRFRYPGRKRLPDRQALQGILFVLHTGIAWRHLPLELGFGLGATCCGVSTSGRRPGSGPGCTRCCSTGCVAKATSSGPVRDAARR